MYKIAVYCFLVLLVLIAKCDCLTECESIDCVDKELIRYVDGLDEGGVIGEFLSVKKVQTGSAKKVDNEEDFIERCARFLTEHEIRLRIPASEARSLKEEGRTKRLRKIILPILLLLKLKAAIIIPIILSIVAFVAFKGLGVGLAALAIAGATGLKSLLENHGHSTISYEVLPQVAAPQWSRSSLEGVVGSSTLPGGYHTIA